MKWMRVALDLIAFKIELILSYYDGKILFFLPVITDNFRYSLRMEFVNNIFMNGIGNA